MAASFGAWQGEVLRVLAVEGEEGIGFVEMFKKTTTASGWFNDSLYQYANDQQAHIPGIQRNEGTFDLALDESFVPRRAVPAKGVTRMGTWRVTVEFIPNGIEYRLD